MPDQAHLSSIKEIFLWRLSYAVLWSVLMQIFFLWVYLCVIYIDLVHPLTWIKDTLILLTSFNTWLRLLPCACILFLQGVYCGKYYLYSQPSYSTRFSFFCHLFSLHNISLCSLHMISGGLTVWLYLSLLGGHYTSVIKSCEKQEGLCLVEGNLFLFLSGFWNGMIYFLKDHALAPPIINFSPIQQAKFIQVKSSLGNLFKKAMKGSLFPVISFAIFYYIKGSMFRNIFVSVFSLKINEDSPVSSFFYMTHLNILFYSWLFSTLFLTTMYSMALLFNVYLTEHNYFAIEPREGTITLSAGLASGPEILNKLAAQDLMIMAYKDRFRRNTVYSLSQPGGHPTNWTNLSNQCLQIINTYCNDLNNIIGDRIVDISPKILYKPQITSPLHIKSPRLRNMAAPYVTNPNENREIIQNEESVSQIIKNEIKIMLHTLSKKPGINYIFGDIPELKLKWIVLRGQTVSRVAQGLSQLVATSIKEDTFGVVQDDLASIITSLLHLKQALDKLSKSGIANKKSLRQDVNVTQMLAELKSAVKRSIYKITITFGRYLKDIPVDKDTMQGLQSFIAMKEG